MHLRVEVLLLFLGSRLIELVNNKYRTQMENFDYGKIYADTHYLSAKFDEH